MDIKQLKYFLAIAEEGQITGAAKRLNIAQPPLSYHLKLLEEELGVKLVERGSRKIQLTDAGKILRNRAEQMLELAQSTVKELKDFSTGLKGTLSIGTVSSSGATLLPERIKSFHSEYPGVSFEVWEGNTFRILEILNNGVIEIGIVRTPFNTDEFEVRFLSKEPMIAVYAKDCNWLEENKSISLADLIDKPLIIYRRFEKIISESCLKVGFEAKIICKNDDARTTLLWAQSGIGIAIVPKTALELVKSTNLKYKDISEPSLETSIAAIWRKDRYLSTAAKHFLEFFEV
ncbi:LysR family transcriptional regulator [Clostridium aciditolerans]|uniref:LysR family transcriptional regulator n=1 Tax=Clostridium aciditolerans TaxID=339861 RepID=A0A934HVB8_9CLOT|nr:LysR family transcriptional regulator [Clostridium aciditolerans]MBI6871552.1 LysR family transcriptional regulator [Clostridium aciditolerans]